MKKGFALLFILSVIIPVYSQDDEISKYSKEINCEYPLSDDIAKWLDWAEEDLDLEKYKTIIRNGDISAIEEPYLNDLQLGVLTKTELKLFRNLFFAKKGYIFSDKELEKYYMQFEWYQPTTKNVTFTDREQIAINIIKLFEAESTIKYYYENRDIVWEQWNGGADQRGFLLKLNKNKTFEYIPGSVINRLTKLTGKWAISNNKIILSVEKEFVQFGGYIASHPNTPYIDKATPATITFDKPIKITLPLNESESDKIYNFTWSESWIMLGSSECYMSQY
ncbi:MAG: YARHG domain-containing protein [Treponema sp.]|nr:YARHG domain-containing protein [Treponema sp.]